VTANDHQAESVSTDMGDRDWRDVLESEFVDVADSPIGDSIGFVFDHPEIGLHGFRWRPCLGKLEACKFEKTTDSQAVPESDGDGG